MIEPFLRAPPFPGQAVQVTRPAPASVALDPRLPDLLRARRVGGTFWLPSLASPLTNAVIVRPAKGEDTTKLVRDLASAGHDESSIVIVHQPGDPWAMLDKAARLFAHGDDEWLAVANLIGLPVTVLSAGCYATPGDDADRMITRLLEHIAAFNYIDPFLQTPCRVENLIAQLGDWRDQFAVNRTIAAACGMAWWKRDEIRRILWAPGHTPHITRSEKNALARAKASDKSVAIWPSRASPGLLDRARRESIPLVRVEDGFIRSVGLGSNLVPPSSVVIDRRGIYYDPAQPSDLEAILSTTVFTDEMVERAAQLRKTIVAAGISKYGAGTQSGAPLRTDGRRIVLVAGQVEDDMSIMAGCDGIASNLDLLRKAREIEGDAEIWFRPHPDVDAGHRKGKLADAAIKALANRIVRDASMAQLLDEVDAVHVLTSLTGFEALLRGREVTCHGTPFYAGWGLTRDLGTVPDRRNRTLSIDELAAATLILYPRYLDPVTGLPCSPEVLISRLSGTTVPNRLSWIGPLRRLQGRLMAKLR